MWHQIIETKKTTTKNTNYRYFLSILFTCMFSTKTTMDKEQKNKKKTLKNVSLAVKSQIIFSGSDIFQ